MGRTRGTGKTTVGRSIGLVFGRISGTDRGTVVGHNLTEDTLPLENVEPVSVRLWVVKLGGPAGSLNLADPVHAGAPDSIFEGGGLQSVVLGLV